MKKKGFTLIELLAVIVVLAIIALIATPIVLNLINNAKEGAAKSSATAYVKAVENGVVQELVKNSNGKYTGKFKVDSTGLKLVSDTDNNVKITVDVSGKLPKENSYVVLGEDGTVTSAYFTIDSYNVQYSDGVANIVKNEISISDLDKNSIEFLKAENIMQKEKYEYYKNEFFKFFNESEISEFSIGDVSYGNYSGSPQEGHIEFYGIFNDAIDNGTSEKIEQFCNSINVYSCGKSGFDLGSGNYYAVRFSITYNNYDDFGINFNGIIPTYFQAAYKTKERDNIVDNYSTKWLAISYSNDSKTYYVNSEGLVSSY